MKLHLILVCLLLPLFALAQVDLTFFPYYNDAVMEDLTIRREQVETIKAWNQEIGNQRKELYDRLLYREDLKVAITALDKSYEAKLHEVLDEEQITRYQ